MLTHTYQTLNFVTTVNFKDNYTKQDNYTKTRFKYYVKWANAPSVKRLGLVSNFVSNFNVYYKILIHDRDNFWLYIGYKQNPAGI